MIDEKKNFKSCSQLTSSQESRLAGQRAAKKAKNATARVPCGELAHVQPIEILNKPLPSLSSDFSTYIRLLQSPGIAHLPPEIIYCILDNLSLPDAGCVAQTSPWLNAIVTNWLKTNHIQKRIASLIEKTYSASLYGQWNGELNLPREVFNECHNTGILLKRVSCLLPSLKRLAFYFSFVQKLKDIVNERIPGVLANIMAAVNGVILQSLIAGWDYNECVTVFHTLNSMFNMPTDVTSLFEYEFSGIIDEKLYLIRMHIRSLYLDFVAVSDRNMWVSIIFNECKIRTADNAASMLLLLFAPFTCSSGGYSLFLSEEDTSLFLTNYKSLADTLVRLVNRDVLKNISFRALFDAVIQKPQIWPFRAQACLVLCVHFYDSRHATSFFKLLASGESVEVATVILSEIFTVANEFISFASWKDCLRPVNNRTLLHLILNALNAGWRKEERRRIVNHLYEDLENLTSDLIQGSLDLVDTEDVREFLTTVKRAGANVSH